MSNKSYGQTAFFALWKHSEGFSPAVSPWRILTLAETSPTPSVWLEIASRFRIYQVRYAQCHFL